MEKQYSIKNPIKILHLSGHHKSEISTYLVSFLHAWSH